MYQNKEFLHQVGKKKTIITCVVRSYLSCTHRRKAGLILILTYLLTFPWSRVPHEHLTVLSKYRHSPRFVEPDGSLPQSQVPASYPYPDADRSSPCPHIPLSEYPS